MNVFDLQQSGAVLSKRQQAFIDRYTYVNKDAETKQLEAHYMGTANMYKNRRLQGINKIEQEETAWFIHTSPYYNSCY